MKIENLKELKEALIKVPEDELKHLVIGLTEDGELRLCGSKGEDEDEMALNTSNTFEKYPTLKDIDKLLINIEKEVKEPEKSTGEPINNL